MYDTCYNTIERSRFSLNTRYSNLIIVCLIHRYIIYYMCMILVAFARSGLASETEVSAAFSVPLLESALEKHVLQTMDLSCV